MVDTDAEQWCDRHNFSQLYRMAVGRRRVVQQPADRSTFIRFLVEWHRLSRPGQSLEDIVHRYRGFRFPLYFFEREILGSRYRGISASTLASLFAQFEELISSGKIIAHSGRTNETGNPYLEFRRRGEGNLLTDKENLLDLAAGLRATAKIVFDFLRENGASYAHDLQWATGLSDMALNLALQELAEKGLTGCENYQSFMLVLQSLAKRQRIKSETPLQDGRAAHAAVRNRRRRTSKSSIRKMVQGRNQITAARWFLTTSLVIMGKPADDQDRAYYQARLLLQRYGILVKEWYRRENGLLPWHQIFQVLKRLEWQGEIRRGYFISGLSGVQFALPEALEILETLYRKPSSGDNQPILLCSMDPALPFSGGDDSGLIHSDGNPLKLNRSPANHLVLMDGRVIITCERYFQRFSVLNDLPQPVWEALSKILHGYLKMSHLLKRATRLEIHQINNQPAAASPYTDKFMKAGFEKDGDKMILWPSAI
jgi:ATP-dependent Lhr-like helicase